MAKETQHQIFLLTETLELILLQLPNQDLIVNAQRVCHRWQSIIKSSVALQQALFFQPLPALYAVKYISFNALLQKAFPPWFRPSFGLFRGARFITSVPWAASPESQVAFMRADASWRKMLPCQPAMKVLEVVGKKNVKEGIFELNGKVRFEDGIRMGCLYDLGFENVRKFVSSFWIQWTEADGALEDKVAMNQEQKMTMFTEQSYFKSGPSKPPDVGEDFRSEAYEELAISIKKERRSMQWHGGFAQPPYDGWKLR